MIVLKLYKKVYIVHSGYCDASGDSSNYKSYKVIAASAEDAIEKVKDEFVDDGEYAESVELVLVLD